MEFAFGSYIGWRMKFDISIPTYYMQHSHKVLLHYWKPPTPTDRYQIHSPSLLFLRSDRQLSKHGTGVIKAALAIQPCIYLLVLMWHPWERKAPPDG